LSEIDFRRVGSQVAQCQRLHRVQNKVETGS
jgi:hypothetical protein